MALLGVIFLMILIGIGAFYLVRKKITTQAFLAISAAALMGAMTIASINSISGFVFYIAEGVSLSVQVQEEVDLIEAIVDVADKSMKMRIGLRSGLDELTQIARSDPNKDMRMRAESLLKGIAADYESVHRARVRRTQMDPATLAGIYKEKEGESLLSRLVEIVRTTDSLDQLAYAFLALRATTGFPFRMFDVEAVEQWCGENKPRCESDPAN